MTEYTIREGGEDAIVTWDGHYSHGPCAEPKLTLGYRLQGTINFNAEDSASEPVWVLGDEWGEEITLDCDALDWLADLLPRIRADRVAAFLEGVTIDEA